MNRMNAKVKLLTALILGTAVLSGCAQQPADMVETQTPVTILRNAHILTLNPDSPTADTMVISGNTILEIRIVAIERTCTK